MSAPIRIGLNSRALSSGKLRGFARHTISLIEALKELEDAPELHLFTDQKLASVYRKKLRNCRVHTSSVRPHVAWEQAVIPALAAIHRIHVLHSPINIGIPAVAPGVKRVVTWHDLITLKGMMDPSRFKSPEHLRALASFQVSWQAAKTADAIIAVSEHTKREIEAKYPALAPRVHVIHNGVDSSFSPGEADPDILAKHGLSQPFFLYVGGFESRKNVETLLDALRVFGRTVERPTLALVGEASDLPDSIVQRSVDLISAKWLGYVSDQELIHIYRGALATVIPSREEGFGLQVAEAMACGSPVISSNATSLPEVGGDAPAYFDPESHEGLVPLLEKAWSDPAWRADLREKGLARAREFSWRKTARQTLDLYRSLLLES